MLLALFAVAFVDELASGIAPSSIPEAARDLGVLAGPLAATVLTAFHSLALVVEGPLLAWSQRFTIRTVSSLALFGLAGTCLLAACAPNAWTLAIALALYGPASGVALAASEGALVESRPDAREQTMARLGIAGALGDLTVPILLGALAWAGLGWRGAMIAAALAALALAWMHASARALSRPTLADDEESGAPLREAIRVALRTRPLLAWSLAVATTTLLDEVMVAFSAIHLDAIGASSLERSGGLGAWTLGGLAGLVVLERIATRVRPERILLFASTVCAGSLTSLALTDDPSLAIALLAPVGASGAMLHPLAKARAYASLPGRPAIVNAVGSISVVVDLLAPISLGLLATHFGSAASVTTLLVAPIAVFWVAAREARRERT